MGARVPFFAALTAAALLLAATAPVRQVPDTVFLEELTWTEVREAIDSGTTTIIVATAGNEQNGPHMVLGKHHFIVKHAAERIARELGNALVGPVVTYVPEGTIERLGGRNRAGTITLPNEHFMKLLEHAARSLAMHGFTDIVFIGDSGGNQRGMREVAATLNEEWVGEPARVHFIGDYYSNNGINDWLISEGETEETIGSHAGIRDTSQLMYVAPQHIRQDKLAPGGGFEGSGVSGDPSRASTEYGSKGIELKVEAALRQIRTLMTAQTEEPDTGAGSVLRVDAALDALVPDEYYIEKLHGDFVFTEGPVWVRRGDPHLLFSDLGGNAIHKWSTDGLSTFMEPVFDGESEARLVGSNGLTLDPERRLILFEHGNRRVSRIGEDGTLTVLVDNYQGNRLNSPNDGVFKSDGWLYFTDPSYGLARLEADPARELDFNGIYRLSPGGELELLSRDQARPNGIAFSPDEETLYVANSDTEEKVWMAYDVQEDGTIANGRVFFDASASAAPGVPDGLKVDRAGNLFATGPGGVWVIDPSGKHLGTIQPDEIPANVAWGDDGRTLYMTARTGLYRIALTTEGPIPGR